MVDMSSATVHRMPEADPVDKMINRTVKALMAIRDMDPPAFMAAADMNKSTYYNRMKLRSGWTAAEVKRAADALGVSVATLYDGLAVAGAGFEPATSGLRASACRWCQAHPHRCDSSCWCDCHWPTGLRADDLAVAA